MTSINYICAILTLTFILCISRSMIDCQSYHYSNGWEPGKRDIPESRVLLDDGVQPYYDRWMQAKHRFHQNKRHYSNFQREIRGWSSHPQELNNNDMTSFVLHLPTHRCSQLLTDIQEFGDLTRVSHSCYNNVEHWFHVLQTLPIKTMFICDDKLVSNSR